jgi:hypothetical protein
MMRSVIPILFCLLVGSAAFIAPVHANPIDTTLVNYSIYQDNQLIDATINLSVKCYGTYHANYFRARHLPENQSAMKNYGLIYSYSLSCEPGSCFRKDVYGSTSGLIINCCDLEGTYKGEAFFVSNFTSDPEPSCRETAGLTTGGYGEPVYTNYYALSAENRAFCDAQHADAIHDTCDTYLVSNLSAVEGQRHSNEWRNNTWYYGTEDYIRCARDAITKQRLCYENRSLTNLSATLKARPSLYCEKRFDLPSASETSSHPFNRTHLAYMPQSPVESLYCSIVQYFGGKCE